MLKAWHALLSQFNRFFGWIIGRSAILTAIRVEELPNRLNTNNLYLVGEGDHLWFAAMICPCGCRQILYMGLMPDQRPRWTVSVHRNNSVSLHPSVWRKIGCKSHFWLKHGRIIWHKDLGRP
jgi:hypothetical protein